jgi:hypothetical protein
MHFRGIPSIDFKVWQPICSTRATPVTGDTTTHPGEVECEACRRILRLGGREWKQPKQATP